MTCSMIREQCAHWVEKYASFARTISEDPLMSAPFVTSGGIGSLLAGAIKVTTCTTPFWSLFQAAFSSCVAVHSALISPFQSLPTKRTTCQSLIKSTLHVAWALRAGVINAVVFDVLKHVSMGFGGENRYLHCFWDVVSVVAILPVIANPMCSFTMGAMIVGGVAVVSHAAKYIADKSNTTQPVPIDMSLILASPINEPQPQPKPLFDPESRQYYFQPPSGNEFNKLVEKYQVQGEYQAGGGEGRLHKLKNLHQPGQPKQPCDVVTLFKPDDQIAFERNEERRRRGRSESSIFFEHLENIRDCFSLEITPLKSFRERMQCLITKQGRLANQLAKELDHLLKTRWKDAYSSFLICGKQELVELGYREDDAQKMHALVLFYKPLPKEPTPL